MAVAALKLALLALLTLAAHPAATRADTYSDYHASEAALEELLEQRKDAEAALSRTIAAEQDGIPKLAAVESKLHRALRERVEAQAAEPELARQVEAAVREAESVATHRARLERRAAGFEVWLFDYAPLPQAMNVRAYQRTAHELAAALDLEASLGGALAARRQAQAALVDRLGALNSEVAARQEDAERLAAQVGSARAGALEISRRVADIQKEGDELAGVARRHFEALRAVGHPVGVSRIAATDGPPALAEPVVWPGDAPAYTPPSGSLAASLASGSALFLDREQLAATGALDRVAGWTAPAIGQITTPFGDATPYQPAHYAVDIGSRLYAPVVAAAGGTVEYAGLAAGDNRLASYGLVVVIRHGDRLTSLYAHLDDRVNGLAVTPGQMVRASQIVGYVGLTGYSTGPHLHFEVRLDNQPIDPALLVPLGT
jgi:murein DD-endopeptidase MepM/ murein hydrolase activator NlpD